MVLRKGRLVVALLLLVGVSFASAGTIEPILELKALSVNGDTTGIVDPHEITVNVNDTVQIVYEITDAPNLIGWQDDLLVMGPASELTLVSMASWWENQPDSTAPATSLVLDARDPWPGHYPWAGEERWLLLAENNFDGDPPYAFTPSPGSSVAVFEFTCEGPGDVIIQAALQPLPNDPDFRPDTAFYSGDPATADPAFNEKFSISNLSDTTVTIHQIDDGPRDWSFEYEVNNVLLGDITGTPEGDYPQSPTPIMDIIATPFPLPDVVFVNWTLDNGPADFPGDLNEPDLGGPFALTGDVFLTANFAVIPEPATFALLVGGAALLARRRRR